MKKIVVSFVLIVIFLGGYGFNVLAADEDININVPFKATFSGTVTNTSGSSFTITMITMAAVTPTPSLKDLYKYDFSIFSYSLSKEEMYSTYIKETTGLKESDFVRYKIKYKSTNDKMVSGYVCAPKDYLEKKYPAVIFCDNKYGTIKKYSPTIDYLASFGAIVFAVDYGYSENIADAANDEIGGRDKNDIYWIISNIKQQSYMDGRVFMVGYGRGAINTCLQLQQNREITAAAIVSGIYDLAEVYNSDTHIASDLNKAIGGPPSSYQHQYILRSPMYWANLITTPMLIYNYEKDSELLLTQASDFYKRMFNFGRPANRMIDTLNTSFKSYNSSYKNIMEWLLNAK